MKFAEFAAQVSGKYAEVFPASYCRVAKYLCLGKHININMYLSGKMEGKNLPMIADNDMFKISLNITLPDNFNYETDELPEKLVMECWSNTYLVKPEIVYLAYGSRKIPYRKTTGTAEKLVATIGKFIEKLHQMVSDDLRAGNIHENFLAMVEENLG